MDRRVRNDSRSRDTSDYYQRRGDYSNRENYENRNREYTNNRRSRSRSRSRDSRDNQKRTDHHRYSHDHRKVQLNQLNQPLQASRISSVSGQESSRHRQQDYRNDHNQNSHPHHNTHKFDRVGGHGSSGSFIRLPTADQLKVDKNLPQLDDDPRIDKEKGIKYVKTSGGGQNTESFDPKATLVRPDLRLIVGPNRAVYNKPLKHDDVIIVPEFFCEEENWDLYYKLVSEIRELQNKQIQGAEFISWHEGAHLIVKDPKESPTFQMIQNKIATYFNIKQESIGTRFNWYRDSSDFKPFHHDSAAFNPRRAQNQNITVGVSFGATRELAFLHANNKCKNYFPQTNGMLFSFGRDVNLRWKHGINALAEEQQDGKGRISIVLWGLAPNCIEESNNPPMLTDNTRGHGHSIHHTNNRSNNSTSNSYGNHSHHNHHYPSSSAYR